MRPLRPRAPAAAVVLVAVTILATAGPVAAADHAIVGKVVAVDHKGHTITIATGGKHETFAVAHGVEVIGPKGGVSGQHLNDKRLAPGAEVKLVFGGGGKSVTKIHIEK